MEQINANEVQRLLIKEPTLSNFSVSSPLLTFFTWLLGIILFCAAPGELRGQIWCSLEYEIQMQVRTTEWEITVLQWIQDMIGGGGVL